MSVVRNLVADGQLNRFMAPGDVLTLGETINKSLTTVGAGTLLAAQLCSGILQRTGPTAAFTDTTDTAANIISFLDAAYNYGTSAFTGQASGVGVQNGVTIRLKYVNQVAYAATIAAGAGVTLGINAATVNASSVKEFLITVTCGTPAQLFAATTTNASAVVTGLTQFQTSQLTPGMAVSGTGIPASTTVLSVQNGVGITLSANATASGSMVGLTFNPTVQIDGLGQGLL